MKYFAHYLKSFWFYLFGNKIDKLNLKLEKAAIDATHNRYKLKKEFPTNSTKILVLALTNVQNTYR